MSQASKIVLAVVITAIVVGGGVYFWQKRSTTLETPSSASQEPARVGFIEGNLEGPPVGLPLEGEAPRELFKVCAEDVVSKKQYCLTSESGPYRIGVPAGAYQVFSVLLEPEKRDTKIYYTEFVTCGFKADCPSHSPITINVVAEQTIFSVDPIDWY